MSPNAEEILSRGPQRRVSGRYPLLRGFEEGGPCSAEEVCAKRRCAVGEGETEQEACRHDETWEVFLAQK
jgi:hypothetical protein